MKYLLIVLFFLSFQILANEPASTCVINCTDKEIEKNKEINHRETKSQGIQWQKLISGNGHVIYIAPNLSKWSGNNILLTFMTSNEKGIENSNIYSQIVLTKLDCQNFRYALNLIISKDETMGKGKTLHVEKYPNDWIKLGRRNKDFYQEMLLDTCKEEHVKKQLEILRNK